MKHKKSIFSIMLLLCFSFLIAPLFTQTAKAQSSIDVSVNNWSGDFSNAVELAPNVFGQVEFKFSPSTTCTLDKIGFYGKGTTANVNIYLAYGGGWTSGGSLAQATANLRSDYPGYVMQWEWADFSSSNIVLTVGNTYIVSIQSYAYPPAFWFSTQTTGYTWNWTGTGGTINDLFYDVRGTPYSGSTSTPTFNPNPTPTPTFNPNPTPTPIYSFPTPTPPPTYILGYGFSSTDLIIILGAIVAIALCSVYVAHSLNSSNKPRRKHK